MFIDISNLNENAGLVVRVRGELLRLLGGHGGVPLDQLGELASRRLDAKRQRRDVQQQKILR